MMALPLIGIGAAIVGAISGGVVKQIANGVLFFLALKALLLFIFVLLLPIVMNNFIHSMIEKAMALITVLDPATYSGVYSVAGALGWFCQEFYIPEAFSVMIAAIQARLILKMIPFSPFK